MAYQSGSVTFYVGYTCSTCLSPVVLSARAQIGMFQSDTFLGGMDDNDVYHHGYNNGAKQLQVYLEECCQGKRNIGFLKKEFVFNTDNNISVGVSVPAVDCACPLCGSITAWQSTDDIIPDKKNKPFLPKLLKNKCEAIHWLHVQYQLKKVETDSLISYSLDDESFSNDMETVSNTADVYSELFSEKCEKESLLSSKNEDYNKAIFRGKKQLKEEIECIENEVLILQEKCRIADKKRKIAQCNYRFDRIIREGYRQEPLCLFVKEDDKYGKTTGFTICLTLALKDETDGYFGTEAKNDICYKEWIPVAIFSKENITSSKESASKEIISNSSIICHKCGTILEADELFCNRCGAPQKNITDTKAVTQVTQLHCHHCGEILDNDEKFCHKCGTPSSQCNIYQEIKNKISNSQPMLRRTFIFISDEEWIKADNYIEKVLDEEPENAYAYLAKILIELKTNDIEDLETKAASAIKTKAYKHALEYGDKTLCEFLAFKQT